MEEIERSAASVEEAIEAALDELGVSEQEAQIQIVQEPRSGFLGLNPRPAVVRVSVRRTPEPAAADLTEQGRVGRTFIEGLMDVFGVDADVEINEVSGITYVDVWGVDSAEDMGLLIGKRGHTIEALQELLRSHVNRSVGERCAIQLDVEDYRKRRRSQIARRAKDVAQRVRKTGRPEALDPMSAYERKIVHDTVAEIGGVESASEGDEPARRVVVRRTRR